MASNLCEQYMTMTLTPSKAAMWQGVSDYISEIKNPNFANDHFDPTTEADILSARARKLDCEVNSDRTITISYKNEKSKTIELPATLHDKCSVVEVIGGGLAV